MSAFLQNTQVSTNIASQESLDPESSLSLQPEPDGDERPTESSSGTHSFTIVEKTTKTRTVFDTVDVSVAALAVVYRALGFNDEKLGAHFRSQRLGPEHEWGAEFIRGLKECPCRVAQFMHLLDTHPLCADAIDILKSLVNGAQRSLFRLDSMLEEVIREARERACFEECD